MNNKSNFYGVKFPYCETDCNKSTIIPKANHKIGDFVKVKINKANSATLFGEDI